MKNIIQSLRALVFFTILTGLLYPLAMTGLGQVFFPKKANGSMISRKGQLVGSQLIAQKFIKPEYFWGRPSASDYSANPSGASNLGPTSQDLKKQINDRRVQLSKALSVPADSLPQDLLTSSASGVDPHISVAGAKIQALRVLQARHLPLGALTQLNSLIDSLTEAPTLGILGEPRVNVLALNLALDERSFGEK